MSGPTIPQIVEIVALGLFLCLAIVTWQGIRLVTGSRSLRFYRLRRNRTSLGWRLILLGVVLGVAGLSVQVFGTRAVYAVIVPTPSLTSSPVPSMTPTATLTPTLTLTPLVSDTPTITPTPSIPEELLLTFNETVTPQANAAFSPIVVAPRLDRSNLPLGGSDTFRNPPRRLFGAFTYNNLSNGVRWTALWYRDSESICEESKPWDGGTGGYGYTECAPEGGWLPGSYVIQMFLGESWKISTEFTIVAVAQTPTPSPRPTSTLTPSP